MKLAIILADLQRHWCDSSSFDNLLVSRPYSVSGSSSKTAFCGQMYYCLAARFAGNKHVKAAKT